MRKNGTKRTVKEFCFSDKGKESNPSSPLGKATIARSHTFYLFILTFAAIYQLQEAGPGLSWLSFFAPSLSSHCRDPLSSPRPPTPDCGHREGPSRSALPGARCGWEGRYNRQSGFTTVRGLRGRGVTEQGGEREGRGWQRRKKGEEDSVSWSGLSPEPRLTILRSRFN